MGGKDHAKPLSTGKDAVTLTVGAALSASTKSVRAIFSKDTWVTTDSVALTTAFTSGWTNTCRGSSRLQNFPRAIPFSDITSKLMRASSIMSWHQHRVDGDPFGSVCQRQRLCVPKRPADRSRYGDAHAQDAFERVDPENNGGGIDRPMGIRSIIRSIDSATASMSRRFLIRRPPTAIQSGPTAHFGDVWYCEVSVGDGTDTSAVKAAPL